MSPRNLSLNRAQGCRGTKGLNEAPFVKTIGSKAFYGCKKQLKKRGLKNAKYKVG